MLVAITGNFATGKSTFASILAESGYNVFDADKYVDDFYRAPGGTELVKREFGSGVISGEKVDKKALAALAFSNPRQLQKLNRLIHPIIRAELQKITHEGKIVFAEIPLLFEAQMDDLFDKIILVKCPPETALSRAKLGGFTEEDFRKRMAYQWPDDKKAPVSDFIVNSEKPMFKLRADAKKITKELIRIDALAHDN